MSRLCSVTLFRLLGRLQAQHSFPTRRSSDLHGDRRRPAAGAGDQPEAAGHVLAAGAVRDRKSTRLNSSHVASSYAVFCLKKKIKAKYPDVATMIIHYGVDI